MLSMISKLGQCAEKKWNRLRGFNYLAKVIAGVKLKGGETIAIDGKTIRGSKETLRKDTIQLIRRNRYSYASRLIGVAYNFSGGIFSVLAQGSTRTLRFLPYSSVLK